MNPSGEAKQYTWPVKEDTCWVDNSNILCTLATPTMASSSTRGYKFSTTDIKHVKDMFKHKLGKI
jgi:hypothetical protein